MAPIETIFFDLDGTLLGVSDDEFEQIYAPEAYKHFEQNIGYDDFLRFLFEGTELMIRNDDERVVVDTFFDFFPDKVKLGREETINRFINFYETNFDELNKACVQFEETKKIIQIAKEKNLKLVLATQPLFYELATIKRAKWAGLNPNDFEIITHATNISHCKPNPKYFQRLLHETQSKPESTLMVGNDYLYDMSASALGIQTFLVSHYQTNPEYRAKFKPKFEGTLDDLLKLIESI